MELIIEKIPVFLTADEALLFRQFQERFQIIASIVGSMDALNIKDIKNASLTMDFDGNGIINHSSITKHYRR